jgi:hypothetical protein
MNWLRKPRLNKAVHRVAVLTVFSLSRVSGLSLVMSFPLILEGEVVSPTMIDYRERGDRRLRHFCISVMP